MAPPTLRMVICSPYSVSPTRSMAVGSSDPHLAVPPTREHKTKSGAHELVERDATVPRGRIGCAERGGATPRVPADSYAEKACAAARSSGVSTSNTVTGSTSSTATNSGCARRT